MSARSTSLTGAGLNLHQIITESMHSLLILATVLIPVSFFAGEYQLQILGVFFFALLANFFIRNLTSYIWQFILASGLVIAISLVLPVLPSFATSLWPRLIAIFFLAFLAVRSFVLRLKQLEEKEIPGLMVQTLAILFLLALNVLATRLDLLFVSRSYFYIAIIYLMLALLRWHRLALAASLDRFRPIPSQPAARIKRFNNLLLAGFALAMLLILFLAPVLHLDEFLPVLGSALLALIRWLFSLFGNDEPAPAPEPEPEPTMAPSQGMQEPILPIEPGETARWLQIVQEVFYYLILALSAAVILGLIGLMIYRLYQRFYETAQPDSDKTESLLPSLASDTKERLARVRKRIFVNFGQTPSEKIRRQFYRLVEGQIRRGLLVQNTYSAGQIMAGLDLERFPELEMVRGLYEAARYGAGVLSSSDVEKMQNWCRKLRRQDLRLPEQEKTGEKSLLHLS